MPTEGDEEPLTLASLKSCCAEIEDNILVLERNIFDVSPGLGLPQPGEQVQGTGLPQPDAQVSSNTGQELGALGGPANSRGGPSAGGNG